MRGVASRNPNDTARGVTALALSKLSEGREGQFFTLGRGRGCEIVKELPINHRLPNDGIDDGGGSIRRSSNPDNTRDDSKHVGGSNNIRTRDHNARHCSNRVRKTRERRRN